MTDRNDNQDHDAELDPGAYIGREPERATETIPGGLSKADERVAAHSTQSGPAGGESVPDGHREGAAAGDEVVRETGQNR